MSEDDVRKRMAEVLDLITSDIASIHSGRATPAIVQDIEVVVYDGQQKLKVNELATITAQDTQTVVIDPWDKSIIGEIRAGIQSANIGLNPVIDGEIIRINIPAMTGEDREKYVRLLSSKLENGRVMVRQIRGDAIKDIREQFEEKQISEDEKFNKEKQLQKITDEFIDKINEAGEKKKQELLQL